MESVIRVSHSAAAVISIQAINYIANIANQILTPKPQTFCFSLIEDSVFIAVRCFKDVHIAAMNTN